MSPTSSARGLRRWAILLVLPVVVGVSLWRRQAASTSAGPGPETLFATHVSEVWVETSGTVERLLSDDREASPHQRFVIRLPSGQTLLVSHNLDLAERVPIEVGEGVSVRGEYVWNERGGLLHWTHRDPQGRVPGGWIRYRGTDYR